ncbi:MAG TPA: XRE family transcriptional regulator [Gammaproteobacteria bacterium]|nr:XRE family transcriptional regulator [Gammaproteobacteria bacterium]
MTPLRSTRLQRKLTLEQVAAEVGLDSSSLSRIERCEQYAGKDAATRLAAFFDLSELEILYPERFMGKSKS